MVIQIEERNSIKEAVEQTKESNLTTRFASEPDGHKTASTSIHSNNRMANLLTTDVNSPKTSLRLDAL